MLWFIVLNAMTLLSVMVRFFNILLWNKLPHNLYKAMLFIARDCRETEQRFPQSIS